MNRRHNGESSFGSTSTINPTSPTHDPGRRRWAEYRNHKSNGVGKCCSDATNPIEEDLRRAVSLVEIGSQSICHDSIGGYPVCRKTVCSPYR